MIIVHFNGNSMQNSKTTIKSFITIKEWQFFRSFEPFKSCLSKGKRFVYCWYYSLRKYDEYSIINFLSYNRLSPKCESGGSTPLYFLKTTNGFKNSIKLPIYKGCDHEKTNNTCFSTAYSFWLFISK